MKKIIVLEFITLDGVIQAHGGPKEDTQTVSNMAVGEYLIMTKLVVR